MIRLQKALADRGVASRRRAEELIAGGRVRVDGMPVTTLGTKVAPDARIDVDGAPTHAASPRYVLLNKPRGIVSTAHDERGRRTVVDLIGAHERLYPVGRLDTDSEGMLLLTNDGDWAQRVIHPRSGHEREYDVSVSGELTPAALEQLKRGVRLEEGLAVATRVEVRSRSRRESHLRMVLHTGWRRQVRRMLSAVGLRTVRLVRVRIGPLTMGKLHPKEWRELTAKEVADLARPVASPSGPPQRRPQQRGPRTARVRVASPVASRAPRTEGPRKTMPPKAGPRTAGRPDAASRRHRSGLVPARARRQPGTTGRAGPIARAGRRPLPYGTKRGPVRARVTPK